VGTLSISDFSRASHLGVKALRHYHRIGLLVPEEVDELTGYRRYGPDQLAEALVIKRFRDLEMPLDEIRQLLATSDVERRAALLRDHLDRLVEELGRMRDATSQLGDLLVPAQSWPEVHQRTMVEQSGFAVRGTLNADAALDCGWLRGALAELGAALRQARARPSGPAVGVYADGVFTDGEGEGLVLVPCDTRVRAVGRVHAAAVEGAALCVAAHHGPHATIGPAYAALGEHVARHAIAVPGPIREIYLTGPLETEDEREWVTEVGWPVFPTTSEAGPEQGSGRSSLAWGASRSR
jgi:DNA-binding transcriptional MerR regulator/effector-binding domain-containing protein